MTVQPADLRTANRSSLSYFRDCISPTDVLLDIGTKDGRKVRDVDAQIVGVDITSAGFPANSPVQFALADATRLPFETNSVDFVHCDQVLEHVPATGELVAEAARVLKPDGLAYFDFPNRFSWRRPHSEVPRYYSILPRPVGSLLANYLLDEASREYYETALAPLSPVSARWHFHSNFEEVVYPMRMDPEAVTTSPVLQKVFWWANSLATAPPLRWAGEFLWPAASYVCARPKQR